MYDQLSSALSVFESFIRVRMLCSCMSAQAPAAASGVVRFLRSMLRLPYNGSDDQVRSYAAHWGLPLDQEGMDCARNWWRMLDNHQADFSFGIKFQYVLNGIWGLMVAVNKIDSDRVFDENKEDRMMGQRIMAPHWLLFYLWWYPGVGLLNFDGLRNSEYVVRRLPYRLGQLADDVLGNTMPDWWQRLPFRRLMVSVLKSDVWIELLVQLSWEEYCGLNMFLRMYSSDIEFPRVETCYRLNVYQEPLEREMLWPRQWYICKGFKSYGQRAFLFDWVLEKECDRFGM